MGEVYRAKDTKLGRFVAVKVLPDLFELDSDRVSRFEREAKAVSALNHPHIVTLYEVGRSDAGPYLVLYTEVITVDALGRDSGETPQFQVQTVHQPHPAPHEHPVHVAVARGPYRTLSG